MLRKSASREPLNEDEQVQLVRDDSQSSLQQSEADEGLSNRWTLNPTDLRDDEPRNEESLHNKQLNSRQLSSRHRKTLRQTRVKQFLDESRSLSKSLRNRPRAYHKPHLNQSNHSSNVSSPPPTPPDSVATGSSAKGTDASFDGVLNDDPYIGAGSAKRDARSRVNQGFSSGDDDREVSASSIDRRCSSSCRRCKAENESFCLECKNPFHFLSSDGSCDYNCPLSGFFKNYANQTCDPCHR